LEIFQQFAGEDYHVKMKLIEYFAMKNNNNNLRLMMVKTDRSIAGKQQQPVLDQRV